MRGRVGFVVAVVLGCACAHGQSSAVATPLPPVKISVEWGAGAKSAEMVLKTVPTLQVVVNPLLRRGSPIHDAAWGALQGLGADDVRYVPWHPYPRLAVAELEAPTKTTSSWDFSLLDPMMADFMHAAAGHSVIPNFSTIPAWMYVTPKPVEIPADPNRVDWSYIQGHQLRDPTGEELAGYYERLVSWYTQGGFTDEQGKRHESGLHYKWPWWEVFNEIDVEHQPTPEEYTKCYDAIVSRLHKLDPGMKFVGLALAFPDRDPAMFEYFLNHANHAAGVPLDMISYHFYASPTREQTVGNWQYSFFDQADKFLVAVRYIDAIRKRLSPETKVDMDEVGSILPTDWHPDTPYAAGPAIPAVYWQASGALYAYVYMEAAKMGVDVVGESQLVGFPSQFPSVTMVSWTTGEPNARMQVLRLLLEATRGGATMARTRVVGSDVDALALASGGHRELLLVNKRDRTMAVSVPAEFEGGSERSVELGKSMVQTKALPATTLMLSPFAVVALTAK